MTIKNRYPKEYTKIYRKINLSKKTKLSSIDNKPSYNINHENSREKYNLTPCDSFYIISLRASFDDSFDLDKLEEYWEQKLLEFEILKYFKAKITISNYVRKFLIISLRPNDQKIDYTLEFIENTSSIDDLPTEGSNIAFLTRIGINYHIRIFNSNGKIILDKGKDDFRLDSSLEARLLESFNESISNPGNEDLNVESNFIKEIILNAGFNDNTRQELSNILLLENDVADEEIEKLRDVLLNSISSFYASDKLNLNRTRYFLPDECTIQLNEHGISALKDRNLYVDSAFENSLYLHDNSKFQISIESSFFNYPIICKQKTKGYYTLDISNESSSLFESIRKLQKSDYVEFAEPSEIASGNACININDLYVHHYIDRIIESHKILMAWGLQSIRMRDAWSFHRGKSNVEIAVIDSLILITKPNNSQVRQIVETRHPAFQYSKISLFDFCSEADNDLDNDGHGNHVAGIICGIDNQNGYLGIAPKCKVLSLGVNLEYGQLSARVDAINFVVHRAMKAPKKRFVINCSWGIVGYHQGLERALQRADRQHNVTVVAASGNFYDVETGRNPLRILTNHPFYPASSRGVITVGGSTINREFWEDSGQGKDILDICAPGVNIVVPDVIKQENVQKNKLKKSEIYVLRDGTSLSCPYVSGIVALIWSIAPEFSSSEIKKLLRDTCTKFMDSNPRVIAAKGFGVINANESLAKSALNFKDKSLGHQSIYIFKKTIPFLVIRIIRIFYVLISYGLFFRNRTLVGTLAHAACPKIMNDTTLKFLRFLFVVFLVLTFLVIGSLFIQWIFLSFLKFLFN